MRQVGLDTCKEIVSRVLETPLPKTLAAIISCTWVYIYGNGLVLFPVVLLLILDTITGVWKSKKLKTYSGSSGFARVLSKLFIYFIMIGLAGILDREIPGEYAMPVMKSFILVTEAISILENISALGWPVPTKLVSILKMFDVDKGKKKKD